MLHCAACQTGSLNPLMPPAEKGFPAVLANTNNLLPLSGAGQVTTKKTIASPGKSREQTWTTASGHRRVVSSSMS